MRNGEALPLTGTAIAALKAGSLDNDPAFVARERLWRISEMTSRPARATAPRPSRAAGALATIVLQA
jgi:hypothetical protein